MTKPKGVFKKRAFRGNKYKQCLPPLGIGLPNVCSNLSSEPRPSSAELSRPTSMCTEQPSSSSKKKLGYLEEDNIDGLLSLDNGKPSSDFLVVDVNQISNLLRQSLKCKFCNSQNFMISSDKSIGLASRLTIKCNECEVSHSSMSSKVTKNRVYEVNVRFVYGLRCIGKGIAAAKTLCALMNLPSPPLKFSKYHNLLHNALYNVAEASMRNAALEAIKENQDNPDIAAVFDGSWQKRGHTSLNGVITVTSFDTGKVLDVECLTKFCHGCVQNNEDKKKHKCVKNHEGASGAMECNGVLKLFQRSEVNRGVRYVKYLGDGDSKGFQHVVSEKPYGAIEITKLECIGHVEKRVGTRLRRLKDKGRLCSDGKGLGGRGRLTKDAIDLLQRYYGLAIMRNSSDVDLMRKAIWAVYYHKLSTDDRPQHQYCPSGPETWCRYNKALENNSEYTHKHSLPLVVMEQLKPVFEDLSKPELLRKCLHGKTQNPNESFNNVIWSRIPKRVFVGLKSLTIGVYDSVLTFNEGAMGRVRVYQELGFQPGNNMTTALRRIDQQRVKKAEKEAQAVTKEARVQKRQLKRRKEEGESSKDNSYGPGEF